MLDGKWEVKQASYNIHMTLLKAKIHCSNEDKCFGIKFDANAAGWGSINFPISLIQQQGEWHIHKKENLFGNIVYHEC